MHAISSGAAATTTTKTTKTAVTYSNLNSSIFNGNSSNSTGTNKFNNISEFNLNCNTCKTAAYNKNDLYLENIEQPLNHHHHHKLHNNNNNFKTNIFYEQYHQQQNNNYQQLDLPEQQHQKNINFSSLNNCNGTGIYSIEEQKKINNFFISNYGYAAYSNAFAATSADTVTTNSIQNCYYLPYNQQYQYTPTGSQSAFTDTSLFPSSNTSASYKNFSNCSTATISNENTSSNSDLSISSAVFERQIKSNDESLSTSNNQYNQVLTAEYQVYQTKPVSTSSLVSFDSSMPKNTVRANQKKHQTADNKLDSNKSNDDRIKKAFGIDENDMRNVNNLEGNKSTRLDTASKASDDNSSLFRNGATLRERNRMHILNDAFDDLRKIVPKTNLSEHQRLSKIATLRLAIHYISALTKILQNSGGCRPVDPSLLPPTPKRKRRRRIKGNENSGAVFVAVGAIVTEKIAVNSKCGSNNNEGKIKTSNKKVIKQESVFNQ